MSGYLNIGMIGSGYMGRVHAAAYQRAALMYASSLPKAPRLYAVADQSQEMADAAAARFGAEAAFGDWRTMVRDSRIDVVDITSPNNLHYEMALEAIEAGKHVYCEKPLAMTAEQARAMTDAARRAGVKTMVAFNQIKMPSVMLAKQIIERGDIGRPIRFRGAFDQGFFNNPDLPWSWRCSQSLAGTGALGDLGAHTVSIAQFLMGDIQAVCASGQTFFPDRPVPQFDAGYGSAVDASGERRAVENEDQVQCLVSFASGAAGVIEASRVCAGRIFGVFWEVSGTEGTIYMDGERFNELQVFRQSDAKSERAFKTYLVGSQIPQYSAFYGFDFGGGGLGRLDIKVIEVHDLVQGICSDADCFPNFAFGLHNQEVLDAAERSMKERRWVHVGQEQRTASETFAA
jgi:predicted dehydrogenase